MPRRACIWTASGGGWIARHRITGIEPVRLIRGALLATALLALAGCKLVDQATFWPRPPAKVATKVGRLALLTIRGASLGPDERAAIAQAIQAALLRRPGIGFDVVAIVAPDQPAALTRGEDAAAEVARAIIAQGVPSSRVHLGAAAEAGARSGEIRVYPG